MNFIKNILKNNKEIYNSLSNFNSSINPLVISGLSDIHKAHFIYSLNKKSSSPSLVLVKNENFAQKIFKDLNSMEIKAILYPTKDLNFYDIESKSLEYEHKRLEVLHKIINNECDVVISSLEAALQYSIPKKYIKKHIIHLKIGELIPIKNLLNNLLKIGYENFDQVEGVGQFALRGGILDIFSPNFNKPIRIEFFDNEIDSISFFDPISQRKTQQIKETLIIPVREILIEDINDLTNKIENLSKIIKNQKALEILKTDKIKLLENLKLNNYDKFISFVYEQPETLFDYISPSSHIFICENNDVKDRLNDINQKWQKELKHYYENGILCEKLDKFLENKAYLTEEILKRKSIYLELFSNNEYLTEISKIINVNSVSLPLWNGSLNVLIKEIKNIDLNKNIVVVLGGTEKSSNSLAEDLKKEGINAKFVNNNVNITFGKIYICSGSLSNGFFYPDLNFYLFTYSHFNRIPRNKDKKRKAPSIHNLSDLNPGNYVVHTVHGIGIFRGIHKIDLQNIKKDYLKIEYAKKDTLYVPITQLDTIDKYIGSKDDIKVKLNKLGSNDFQKAKSKAKKAVQETAKELIKIYSQRINALGHAFSPDIESQKDFEAHFEYEETQDQLRCTEEIKKDMEKKAPMDRLLCGDVGFGKTEVALRAVFKCISDSKQCAFLVPTTVLAWQHFKTAKKRFEKFDVKIELLSRFRTLTQQKKILERLKKGEIDLIIGTHRLVQKDVVFYDLGLVVIDEEQRFGVSQKEKFKEMYKNIDILTLSATPIPRTLNMAMSGIRDMSCLEEAAQDRYPIQTYVLEHNNMVVNEAIRKELRRGGQVYYLYNNISNISTIAHKIQKNIPESKVGYAHGKMNEKELFKVWEQVINGEIDILVCTTIIETGIDIPNINTLIVENSDCMGLSQLHQIRGRVGRSPKRAFTYLTFKKDRALSEISQKRLSAVREFTEFGSGFKIAMRDLELRGSGNILGHSQHGHMVDIGYDMYLRLLNIAVKKEKGEKITDSEIDCVVDLQIEAYIPEKYIKNVNQRIDIYRRISEIRSEEDSFDVMDEMIDRYGTPPKSVNGLIEIALLRAKAAKFLVHEIKQKGENILLFQKNINKEFISNLMNRFGSNVAINAGSNPYISVNINKKLSVLKKIKEIFNVLSN